MWTMRANRRNRRIAATALMIRPPAGWGAPPPADRLASVEQISPQMRSAATPALRNLCRRRWAGRVVDLRRVVMEAIPLCEDEGTLWGAVYQLTGPPDGVAQVVASPRHLVLSFAPGDTRTDFLWQLWSEGKSSDPEWGTIAGEWTEATGQLYRRGLRGLRRRGEDPRQCRPVSQAGFSLMTLEEDRLHPELEAVVAVANSIYTTAWLETDALCRKEWLVMERSHAEQERRWQEVNQEARRRLAGLMRNERLISM